MEPGCRWGDTVKWPPVLLPSFPVPRFPYYLLSNLWIDASETGFAVTPCPLTIPFSRTSRAADARAWCDPSLVIVTPGSGSLIDAPYPRPRAWDTAGAVAAGWRERCPPPSLLPRDCRSYRTPASSPYLCLYLWRRLTLLSSTLLLHVEFALAYGGGRGCFWCCQGSVRPV